jgi:hypothetical protein
MIQHCPPAQHLLRSGLRVEGVEWASIRQIGNTIDGCMWRIWRAPGHSKHLDCRWAFTARSHGSFLR